MILKLQDIMSDFNGFERLAWLAQKAKDCHFDTIEIDMSSTSWFDANMSAPLGVLFDRWGDDFNTVLPIVLRPKFKDFRRSDGFARVVNPVIKDVRQILGMSDIEDTELTHADLPGILEETEWGSLDFNDGAIVETCRRHGFKLLTHDGDMQFGGIEVLTSNPQLLAACP